MTFDLKKAGREQSAYLKKGPKKNSLPLINQLKTTGVTGLSLLDIGSGTGSVIFELFEAGIKEAQYIDISTPYTIIFREETEKRSLTDRVDIKTGDFLDHRDSIKQADLITLDKVICCYKDFENLVTKSVEKCKEYYAYVIPVDKWWVKLFHYLAEKIKKISGKPFETFIHPVVEIEKIVTSNNFQKIHESKRRMWLTVVYENQAKAEAKAHGG